MLLLNYRSLFLDIKSKKWVMVNLMFWASVYIIINVPENNLLSKTLKVHILFKYVFHICWNIKGSISSTLKLYTYLLQSSGSYPTALKLFMYVLWYLFEDSDWMYVGHFGSVSWMTSVEVEDMIVNSYFFRILIKWY